MSTILTAESLKVRYRNGALGIVDVSLEVKAGQVVALFGANGAGKTTTVRAISGFLRSEGAKIISGKVTLFGEDITNCEPHSATKRGIAFVAERNKVFTNMSIAENLTALGTLPPRSRRSQVYDQIYEIFPLLKERSKELAGRLSGGQQQMLAIARGMMCEPKLLIVDELTLGLHFTLHAPLFQAVRKIATETTGVIVVDESASAALSVVDHCYLLSSGSVRTAGPASAFVGSELLAAGYVDQE